MKSLKINFNGADGTVFDLVEVVEGFNCTIQNALVNIGTRRGSDRLMSEKGTDLLKAGIQGVLVDLNAANHASNFAALATLSFTTSVERPDSEETLAALVLQPSFFDGRLLQVDAQFTSSTGAVYGTLTVLP